MSQAIAEQQEPGDAAMAGPSARSLAHRAIHGTAWTIAGYGLQQALRLGSNLVLTRLLMPDAFGLMSLTMVFITGLELLSDVGVGPAIIQSSRGDDTRMLDTAWTVQVIRGAALSVCSLLIAWPAARLYGEPRLAPMLVVAGLGLVIRGLTPTRVHSLNRQVALGRLTVMEVSSLIVSIGVTIGAAALLRSAWALLVGAIVSDVVRVALAYGILPGQPHRFALDRESVREIVHVGRWVLLSTAVTFAAGNLDRLTIGRLLPVRSLGIYMLAAQLVATLTAAGRTVGSRVLFPVLAETIRSSPEHLRRHLRNARAFWVVPTTSALVVLAVYGDRVIRFLYPAAFQDAGWMLRILAAGSIATVLNQSMAVVLPARGEFRTITILMIVQVPVVFAAMLIGYWTYGVVGLVIGCASVEVVMLPVYWAVMARRRLWQPGFEFLVLGSGAAFIAGGMLLRG